MKRFAGFCERYQVHDPFPVSEHLLCSFAAFLGGEGLAPQTVISYLAAIRNTQLFLGFPDPREHSALPVLRRVLAGISRSRIGRGRPSRIRLPITAPLLRDIREELERSADPERRMGCLLHGLLWLLSPGRTATHQAVGLRPETPSGLGGHGGG